MVDDRATEESAAILRGQPSMCCVRTSISKAGAQPYIPSPVLVHALFFFSGSGSFSFRFRYRFRVLVQVSSSGTVQVRFRYCSGTVQVLFSGGHPAPAEVLFRYRFQVQVHSFQVRVQVHSVFSGSFGFTGSSPSPSFAPSLFFI